MIDFISSIFSQSVSFVRAVVGVPDYERYLTHMRTAHPGDRVMTETEFEPELRRRGPVIYRWRHLY